MGSTSPNVSGQRLMNFDINVVAPVGATVPTFNQAARTCTLTCHSHVHNGSLY